MLASKKHLSSGAYKEDYPPMSFDELKAEALVILDALSEAEVERLWIQEAIRRDDEIDQGAVRLRSAEEVFRKAKARFG